MVREHSNSPNNYQRINFPFYYVIKKPRLVDTPQWYVLLSKDKVIWILSTLAMIILITSLGT